MHRRGSSSAPSRHIGTGQATVGAWAEQYIALSEAAASAAAARKAKAAQESSPQEEDASPNEAAAAPDSADGKLPAPPKATRNAALTAPAPRDAIGIALSGRFLTEIPDSPDVDGAIQSTVGGGSGGVRGHVRHFLVCGGDGPLSAHRRNAQVKGTFGGAAQFGGEV
ncbi:hypothetical protein [Streptomyces antibioticus]|uniref:hypothetical protein n=1 Tax=Streptomyces antibioticus TaxID=1890 RepID=UPI003411ADFE